MEKQPNVSRISAGSNGGTRMNLTIGTDVVDYMEAARSFGKDSLDAGPRNMYQQKLVSIPNKKNAVVTPMFLSIGTQQELSLVCHDGAGNGWSQYNLGAAFGESARITAVGADYTPDDHIAIAVAVEEKTGEHTCSRIFIAYGIKSATADWNKLSWTDYGTRDNIQVAGIRVTCYKKSVMTLLVGNGGLKDQLYLISDKQEEKSFRECIVFDAVKEFTEVTSFKTGVLSYLGAGLFVLGKSEGTERLVFRPFPKITAQGKAGSNPPGVQLPCPKGAKVLETGMVTEEGTSIYFGGDGIDVLPADQLIEMEKGRLTSIAPVTETGAVTELVVAETVHEKILCTLDLQGRLQQLRYRPAEDAWSSLLLKTGVEEIALAHGDANVTLSLLAVTRTNECLFMVRDAAQGNWSESALTVKDSGKATKVTCYSTCLRLFDEADAPLVFHKVKLSASALCCLQVNQKTIYLGPGLPAYETSTNESASIIVYDKARSFTPATYRFEVEGLGEIIEVNPARGVFEIFRNLTAPELEKATITNDQGAVTPLVPAGNSTEDLNAVTEALNRLAGLAPGQDEGIRKVTPTSSFGTGIQPRDSPQRYMMAVQVNAGGAISLQAQPASDMLQAASAATSFISGLGESISDFFTGLANKASEGLSFLVKKVTEAARDAYEFICKVGDRIKKFVVSTLEEIGGFFSWLWGKIKVGVEKVWDYVKFLFNWQDILLVRDTIKTYLSNSVDHIGSFIPRFRKQSLEAIDSLLLSLDDLRSRLDVPNLGKDDRISKIAADNTPAEAKSDNDKITGNSIFQWIMQKIKDAFNYLISIEADKELDEFLDALSGFMSGTLSGLFTELSVTFSSIRKNVGSVLGSNFSLSDLSFEKIKQIVLIVGFDVVTGLLHLIRKIVDGVFNLMEKAFSFFRKLMFGKISFPFIEDLYRFITGKDLDTSFTVADVISLLVAVPATIAMKILKVDPIDREAGKPVLQSMAAEAAGPGKTSFFEKHFGKDVGKAVDTVTAVGKFGAIFAPAVSSFLDVWSVGGAYMEGKEAAPKAFSVFSAFSLLIGIYTIYSEASEVHMDGSPVLITLEIVSVFMGGMGVVFSGLFWLGDATAKKGLKTFEAVVYGIKAFLRIPVFIFSDKKGLKQVFELSTGILKDAGKICACAAIPVEEPQTKTLLVVGNFGFSYLSIGTGIAAFMVD